MRVVQVCARCAARWPVLGAPTTWCPRCHGVLLAPIRADQHLPAARRGFRWVARSPLGSRAKAVGPQPAPSPTPRYEHTPQWGLHDTVDAPVQGRDWPTILADKAPLLLASAAVLYLLAALAEIGRYAVLLHNRTRLIDPTLLTISDVAVFATQSGGLLLGLVAAAASACWLIRARTRAFAARRTADPRTLTELIVGCVVPGLNLVMPGLFLLELVRRDPRALLLVRLWWGSWAFSAVLVVFNWFWRSRPGLQAMADGVLLAAFTALVAAGTAVLTLAVLRRLEGKTLRGGTGSGTRWVIATGPDGAPAKVPAEKVPAEKAALAS